MPEPWVGLQAVHSRIGVIKLASMDELLPGVRVPAAGPVSNRDIVVGKTDKLSNKNF